MEYQEWINKLIAGEDTSTKEERAWAKKMVKRTILEPKKKEAKKETLHEKVTRHMDEEKLQGKTGDDGPVTVGIIYF